MASPAFVQRFISTWWIWAGPASTDEEEENDSRISIVDGREARMSFMTSLAMGLTWTIFCTCSVGRLKARIWRVSSAARFPAS
jgi:hypothetical protein